jgi:anti-sigma factor RsiW
MSDSMHDDLACQELVELITDYVEGKLPSAQRARFELHLAACTSCRLYLEQMRQTIGALGRLPLEAITAEAQQALVSAFRGWKG